jgi:dTDP-4-amino-4,6-dideoxygalactose transaminase
LLALGIGPGDEVVTLPMTFIATAASIVQTGARPGFVDMDRLWPERSATRDASASTPGKNLGAWGDGGAVTTNNEEVAQRVSLLSNHGRLSHYAHEICGYKTRLDSIQAAVLRAKLEKLGEWNDCRRVVAAAYRELLAPLDARPILEPGGERNPATTYS